MREPDAGGVAVLAALLLTLIIGGLLFGCANRSGDFAPDQIRWINRNVK